jgi:anti-sigma factor RsiW
MTCQELTDFIMAYLDRELDDETRRSFERHMAVCPSCVAFVRSYEQTVRLGKQAFDCPPDQPAERHAPEDLVKAIIEATKGAMTPHHHN